jgi:hypothetical protein
VSDAPKHPEPSRQPDEAVEGAPAQFTGPTSAPPAAGQPGTADGPPAGPDAPAAPDQPPSPEGQLPAGPGAPTPSRTGRTVAIVVAAVLATVTVLCIGGLGAGYLIYRHVSEPDRSTPGVVTRQYLQATFDDRDKSKASQFTCGPPSDIGSIEQTLTDIISREQRFNIHITVGWENFDAQQNKTAANVKVRLKIEVPEENGQPSESFQQWSFALRHQGSGWRVCGAQRVG